MPEKQRSGNARMRDGMIGTERAPVSIRLADWLGLAATPTFALFALLTAVAGDGHAAHLSPHFGQSPFDSMLPMYLLMAAFHLAPWLRPKDQRL